MGMTIRQGQAGPEVGALQQQLVEAGYAIAVEEAGAQSFGASTLAAVEDFQARHVDAQHNALTVDGVVGPSTAWALEHPGGLGGVNAFIAAGWRQTPDLEAPGVKEVLSAAIAEIGTKEVPDGSNAGPRVDLYQAPEHGLPWCAAFVCWAWAKPPAGRPFPRKLGVFSLYEDFKAAGHLVAAGELPRPGDVFLILRAQGHGHCGLVVSVTDDGLSICTCEGNASKAVRGMIRPIASIAAFARPLLGLVR